MSRHKWLPHIRLSQISSWLLSTMFSHARELHEIHCFPIKLLNIRTRSDKLEYFRRPIFPRYSPRTLFAYTILHNATSSLTTDSYSKDLSSASEILPSCLKYLTEVWRLCLSTTTALLIYARQKTRCQVLKRRLLKSF